MKKMKNSEKYQKMSKINIINRGELILNREKKSIVAFLIIVMIVFAGGFIYKHYKYRERDDVKIPVLLYHNFVTTVPDSDPDNFQYINTPESFEENIKTLLENGKYSIIG